MKRMLTLFLLTTLLFGCSTNKIQKSAEFYYPPQDYIYLQEGNLLDFETRDTADLPNMASVLDRYMEGPQSIRFLNPFPAGCKVISLRHYDATVELVVSNELAQLTGISLPLACACLARTCMEMTGAETVRIRAQGLLLDGEKDIVMTRQTLNITSNSLPDDQGREP